MVLMVNWWSSFWRHQSKRSSFRKRWWLGIKMLREYGLTLRSKRNPLVKTFLLWEVVLYWFSLMGTFFQIWSLRWYLFLVAWISSLNRFICPPLKTENVFLSENEPFLTVFLHQLYLQLSQLFFHLFSCLSCTFNGDLQTLNIHVL